MIVFVGAVVVGGTGAFFSDTETSTENVFTAGAIDLKVDSVGHVNGLVCFGDVWTPESEVVWVGTVGEVEGHLELVPNSDVPGATTDYNTNNPANVPQAGEGCGSTWALTDLKDGVHTFFDFADIKPGDEGENTISLHVDNNDAWMCVDIDITNNDDVSSTEPELETTDVQDIPADLFDGELADHMNFFAWADDGDNIWQDDELPLFSNLSGPASDVLGGVTYTLADSLTGVPFPGATTQYVGLAWCAGTIDATTPGTILCDGSTMGNEAQTDSMTADIAFRVEQARNNEKFVCDRRVVEPETTLSLEKVIQQDQDNIVDETSWTLFAAGLLNISGSEGDLDVTNRVVPAGDYVLTEDGLAGFTQTDLQCSGGILVGNTVTIAEGENVTCTFTNVEDTLLPPVVITNVTNAG